MPETPLISLDHEELVIRKGRRTGVYTIVAVHSTTLGPALGGCRMWRYESSADGARDALRLSRAMTFKAAACGLALGGGKGVICLEPGDAPTGGRRRELLLDFADTVDVLHGSYIIAEDVGTSAADMAVIREVTKWVSGLPRELGGSGDPSPFTALGVVMAMRACCAHRFGSPELTGRTISVVGAGRVGSELAKLLAGAGAELTLSDIDGSRRGLADELGARWTDPSSGMLAKVDVLAPCALGGVIDQVNVDRLRCRVVCGSANNQLAHEGLAEDLAARGVLYAPDFIANAGGLINVSLELGEYDPGDARRRVEGIEETMAELLRRADAEGITPLAAAYELARQRLDAARRVARSR
ncbi:MAG: Glu/Leu/Phe/Val dehydrogenase [Thermoleophilaceae bacterium]|nr:Glu/Leu/Phe/Val dehydrogenase [Thermoleophilaceae bacterium]